MIMRIFGIEIGRQHQEPIIDSVTEYLFGDEDRARCDVQLKVLEMYGRPFSEFERVEP